MAHTVTSMFPMGQKKVTIGLVTIVRNQTILPQYEGKMSPMSPYLMEIMHRIFDTQQFGEEKKELKIRNI